MDNPFFFNSLDYFYIAVMLVSSAFGFTKGFTRVFLSLCAWISSGFFSTFLVPYISPFISQHFTEKSIIRCISIGLAYIITLIALLLATHFFSDNVKRSILSGVDRAMGVLFGLLRGIFLPFCVCLILLISNVSLTKFEIIEKSKISGIFFEIAGTTIVPYLEQQGIIKKKESTKSKTDKAPKIEKIEKMKKSAAETLKASKIRIIPKRKLKKK